MAYGVVLFYSTQGAIRAEKALLKAHLPIKLIPVPRHLSSECGLALRFDLDDQEAVAEALLQDGVEFAEIRPL